MYSVMYYRNNIIEIIQGMILHDVLWCSKLKSFGPTDDTGKSGNIYFSPKDALTSMSLYRYD